MVNLRIECGLVERLRPGEFGLASNVVNNVDGYLKSLEFLVKSEVLVFGHNAPP